MTISEVIAWPSSVNWTFSAGRVRPLIVRSVFSKWVIDERSIVSGESSPSKTTAPDSRRSFAFRAVASVVRPPILAGCLMRTVAPPSSALKSTVLNRETFSASASRMAVRRSSSLV